MVGHSPMFWERAGQIVTPVSHLVRKGCVCWGPWAGVMSPAGTLTSGHSLWIVIPSSRETRTGFYLVQPTWFAKYPWTRNSDGCWGQSWLRLGPCFPKAYHLTRKKQNFNKCHRCCSSHLHRMLQEPECLSLYLVGVRCGEVRENYVECN